MTYQAAVLEKVGEPLVVREIDNTDLEPNEVLVDVKACGLCHSDLSITEKDFGWPVPAVLGHEMSGVVEQVGNLVTTVKVGDRVVSNLISSCGSCANCMRGKVTTCLRADTVRRDADSRSRMTIEGEPLHQIGDIGGFAEKTVVHERNLVPIGDEVSFAVAGLLGCAVLTGIGAVKNTARVQVGDTVAVTGCGGVGLNVIQGAALVGARKVIAIDLQDEKLALADQFGATDLINPSRVEDVAEKVREIVGARGVDHSFEVIGLNQTAQQAIELADVGGTTYAVGMQPPGSNVSLVAFDLLRGQKALQGLHMGTSLPWIDIPMYVDFYRQGRLQFDELVSQTITLDQINQGYSDLKSGRIARSVVVFE